MATMIKNFILYLWQLPQNILGLLIIIFCRLFLKSDYINIEYKNSRIICVHIEKAMAVSLGKYIICFHHKVFQHTKTIHHEYGHCIQSQFFGPLYLVIIGIASFSWALLFDKYRAKNNISYYAFWTERWADKLGGVTRG